MNHVLVNAKGYVSLLGALVTALLGVYGPDTTVGRVLTIVSVLVTAYLTWQVPNAESGSEG